MILIHIDRVSSSRGSELSKAPRISVVYIRGTPILQAPTIRSISRVVFIPIQFEAKKTIVRRIRVFVAMAMLWSVEVRNAVLAVVVASVIVHLVVFKFVRAALREPLRLRRIMTKQGVRGPPFKFLLGQYMDMVKFSESFPETLAVDDFANLSPTVSPRYAMYFSKHGNLFLYWWRTDTTLVVIDPEIVKELLITNHDSSAMVEAMVQKATTEIQIWEKKKAEACGEVEIDVELGVHKTAGRIMSRVTFSDG